LSAREIDASSKFITNYDVTYTIYENQNSNVKINITLINTTDTYYASSYKIRTGFKEIKNIKAYSSSGQITPTVLINDDNKVINLEFNEKTVGKGNMLNFTLSFDTFEIAHKLGNIWEINIPSLSKQENLDNLKVRVVVPLSFGEPSFIKPLFRKKVEKKENFYEFSKEDLGKSGISMTFGNEQIYEFKLKYNLSNKNIYPIKTEIALPPVTGYQDIIIDEINPKPVNVITDEDGNWLAQYLLSPRKKITVNVRGKVKLKLNPSKETLTQEKKAYYLKEIEYWESSNPHITSIAKKLKTPQNIYNYVVNKLNYDFSRVRENKPRLGALKVLNNPSSAVCLEFTDLFIALARAAGIPAREVNGYGFTGNSKERPLSVGQDILHSWPEYYDERKQVWIMIDPTWGKTTGGIDFFNTIDFDHIAFVIKGFNSKYPIPAGGYKFDDKKNSKDIYVAFSQSFFKRPITFRVIENFSNNYISGFGIKGKLMIENTGNTISDYNQITVMSNSLKPSRQKISFKKIPPFGNITIPISFERTPFLTKGPKDIKISIGETEFLQKVNLSPFFLDINFIGGSIFVGLLIIGSVIYFFKARNLFL